MGHHSFSRFVLLVITAVVQLLLLSTHVRAQYDYSTLAASSDSNAGAYSYSGAAIATSGTVVAIGAPQADIHGVTTDTSIYGTGFVLLYNCPLTSGQYVCGTPSYYDDSAYSGSSDSLYGFSVALINNGQILIVGAPDYSGSHGEGVVFFYNCPAITSCALAYDVGDYVMGVSLAAAMTSTTVFYAVLGNGDVNAAFIVQCSTSSAFTTTSSWSCGITDFVPSNTVADFGTFVAMNTNLVVVADIGSSSVTPAAYVYPIATAYGCSGTCTQASTITASIAYDST